MNISHLFILIALLAGLIVVLVMTIQRLKNNLITTKQNLKDVKQERDDLVLGYKRIKENAEKYQVIKTDSFNSDINELIERMRRKGQVDES